MLSLAIVSLSPCSEAISSRTGATILHGPHHSAQKSTRTGLSLPRTSSAKVASVTVTVLPAMVVLLVVRGRRGARSSGRVGLSGQLVERRMYARWRDPLPPTARERTPSSSPWKDPVLPTP